MKDLTPNLNLPAKALHHFFSRAVSRVAQIIRSSDNEKTTTATTMRPKGKDKPEGPIRTPVTHSHRVNKLVPPRPFPTVPAGVSATGPRSAHHEGKNYITITRRTQLGTYLRRCKDLVLKDGCVILLSRPRMS